MRKRFKRFFRFQLSLPASSCRASAFLFVNRRRRRRPENEWNLFSPFDSNSFSSPRSRPLTVRLYSFGSRTGILHSPAPVEAALAGASGRRREGFGMLPNAARRRSDGARLVGSMPRRFVWEGGGIARFGIFRDPSPELLFFVLDRRGETIYNKKRKNGG